METAKSELVSKTISCAVFWVIFLIVGCASKAPICPCHSSLGKMPPTTIAVEKLTKESVEKTLATRMPQIQNCYEKILKTKPDLEGKIVFNFLIAQNGSVARIGVKDTTMHSNDVEGCIQKEIAQLQFPPPTSETVEIIYPYLFRVKP